MTLVERMARAISRSIYGHEDEWENWTDTALDVLRAMREPTDSMIEAHSDASDEHWPSALRAEQSWQAMIDQAIKEAEQ